MAVPRKKWTWLAILGLAIYLSLSENSFYDRYTYNQRHHVKNMFGMGVPWQVNPEARFHQIHTTQDFNEYVQQIFIPNTMQLGESGSHVRWRNDIELFELQLHDPAWRLLGPVFVQQIRFLGVNDNEADERGYDYNVMNNSKATPPCLTYGPTDPTGQYYVRAHAESHTSTPTAYFQAGQDYVASQDGLYAPIWGTAQVELCKMKAWFDITRNTWVSYRDSRALYLNFLLINGDQILLCRIGRFIRTTGGLQASMKVLPMKPPSFWPMCALLLLGFIMFCRCTLELIFRGWRNFFMHGQSAFDFIISIVIVGLIPLFVLMQINFCNFRDGSAIGGKGWADDSLRLSSMQRDVIPLDCGLHPAKYAPIPPSAEYTTYRQQFHACVQGLPPTTTSNSSSNSSNTTPAPPTATSNSSSSSSNTTPTPPTATSNSSSNSSNTTPAPSTRRSSNSSSSSSNTTPAPPTATSSSSSSNTTPAPPTTADRSYPKVDAGQEEILWKMMSKDFSTWAFAEYTVEMDKLFEQKDLPRLMYVISAGFWLEYIQFFFAALIVLFFLRVASVLTPVMPALAIPMKTLKQSASELLLFSIAFIIILGGCGMYMMALYQPNLDYFQNMYRAYVTLLRGMVHGLEVDSMFNGVQNSYTGELFLASILFILNYAVVNMFIIIIMQAYIKIEKDVSSSMFDMRPIVEAWQHFKKQPSVCCEMGCCGLRYLGYLCRSGWDYEEESEDVVFDLDTEAIEDEHGIEVVSHNERMRREKEKVFFDELHQKESMLLDVKGNIAQLCVRLHDILGLENSDEDSMIVHADRMRKSQQHLDKVLLVHCKAVLSALAEMDETPEEVLEEVAAYTESTWDPSSRRARRHRPRRVTAINIAGVADNDQQGVVAL